MPDPLNMASSGKKGKKSKGKTLPLNHFLQDTPGTPPAPIRKPTTNWAEEVEDSFDGYDGGRNAKASNVVLPTAPKAARGIDDFSDKIPQSPPFIAYLSNLPYDVEEDEIADFFRNLKISNMRIPKEDRAGEGTRVKGFGYVEFEDQESLIEALAKPTCILKGRRIRIEVATNSDSDRSRRTGGRMDMNRDRQDRPEVSTGDWRSGGRKEPEAAERRQGGGFNRDRGEGFGRDREGGGGFTRDREGGGGGFNRDREGGGGGFTRDREGGFTNRDREPERAGAWRDSSDRPSFRDNDKGMQRDGGPPRDRYERDGDRRGGFGPRRMDRDERNGSFTRGGREEREPERNNEPRMRPKLNLAPRSKPAETEQEENAQVPAVKAPAAAAPAASIFGNAKPVDTTARERQIEERLAKQNSEVEQRDNRRDDDRRRDDRKRSSPERRRYSPPPRRTSPNNRRDSPEFRRNSPEPAKYSPDRKRGSPDRKWGSPERKRGSPERKWGSPDGKKGSPDRKKVSPDRKQSSPERKKSSPDRNKGAPRRLDDKRAPPRNEKQAKDRNEKEKKPPREYTERDMPKLKTPEPINIVNTNQYSFLDPDASDCE